MAMVLTNERAIAALVPMAALLGALGFQANEGAHRCACILHGGSNRSAFSWTDTGLWKCHSCGAGGDRIALVRALRTCSFREALRFLASFTGVDLKEDQFSPGEGERLRQERQSEERAAHFLADSEHTLLLALSEELESLRRLRFKGAAYLTIKQRPELCWATLKLVADTLPRTDVAYCICAFAAPIEQARFALHPELRSKMIDLALERGFVSTAKGYRIEVPLQ